MSRRIPLIVHQIWMQGADLVPAKYDNARESWRRMHPDGSGWTIKTWDEAGIERVLLRVAPDFGMTPNELVEWYRAIPQMIQRADVGRCFILYAEGGVYADMDTLSLQPMTSLMDEAEANAAANDTPHAFVYCKTINNAVFASSTRHPLFTDAWWPDVSDALSGEKRKMGWLSRMLSTWGPGMHVVFTTGPMMWGRILDGGFPFGGGMTDARRKEWGILRPPHHAFYPAMGDGGRLETLSSAQKQRMAAQGGYTYHSQESEWLHGFSLESMYMAMTRTQTRRTVLVCLCAALFLIALMISSVFIIKASCERPRNGFALVTGSDKVLAPTPPPSPSSYYAPVVRMSEF